MPIKTLVGDNVATLLRQAEAAIGPDAVVLHVRRVRGVNGLRFEVTAADPASAARGVALPQSAPTTAMELMVPAQPAAGPLVIALVGPTGAGKTMRSPSSPLTRGSLATAALGSSGWIPTASAPSNNSERTRLLAGWHPTSPMALTISNEPGRRSAPAT